MKKDETQLDLFAWADNRPTAKVLDFFELGLYPRLSSPVPFYGARYDHTEILPMRRTA